ncbi:SBBP repeat-containing protein [Sorangium sp. So ce119]|uniref:SBBP repeat-containing protein n=1 Tax=Sorangium sp. So ce119 TaxID=3133279 RepID=UPI003F6387E3
MQARAYVPGSIAGLILCASGCAALLGLDEFTDRQSLGGAGGVGGAGGAGSAGGAGGGDEPTPCTPDASEACYGGPPVTWNEGICREGVRTCSADGTWGVCEGEILPAVERCDAADDENCDGLECLAWTTAFKQTGDVHLMDIASDADGNMFVTGAFLDTITIGGDTLSSASTTDILLLKLSPTGEPLWSKKFGDSYPDEPWTLAVDFKGNPILSGISDSGIDFGDGPLPAGPFIAKLDASGKRIWTKGPEGGGISAVAIDANDDVIVAGSFSRPIDFGSGPIQPDGDSDIFVAKLDGATGLVTAPGCWARRLGRSGASVNAAAIATDRSNNIFMAGSTLGTAELDRFTLDRGSFVMKLTPSGVPDWIRTMRPIGPSPAGVDVMGIAVDSSGRPVLAGDHSGELQIGSHTITSVNRDVFVVQFEANGTVGWVRTLGGTDSQMARGLALDPFDNVVVVGNAQQEIDLGNGPLPLADDSGFVVKLSPDAELVWHRFLGKDAVPYAVASSPSGETLVTGWTRAPDADWGAGPLPGPGDDGHQRLVIAKLGR